MHEALSYGAAWPALKGDGCPALARSRRGHIGRDRGQIAHSVYGDDPNGVPSHTQRGLTQ
jgi:hypothetical protein